MTCSTVVEPIASSFVPTMGGGVVPSRDAETWRRGSCSCGWKGEPRERRSDAQADALEHVNGRAPARKPKEKRARGFFA